MHIRIPQFSFKIYCGKNELKKRKFDFNGKNQGLSQFTISTCSHRILSVKIDMDILKDDIFFPRNKKKQQIALKFIRF